MSRFGRRSVSTEIDVEIAHLCQVLVQFVHQQLDTMEAQSTAFVVEVKVDIMRLRFSASLESLFHRIFNGKLVPLVVDKVNKVGVPIYPDLFFNVELQRFDLLTQENSVNKRL
jgi:hypothetical protein